MPRKPVTDPFAMPITWALSNVTVASDTEAVEVEVEVEEYTDDASEETGAPLLLVVDAAAAPITSARWMDAASRESISRARPTERRRAGVSELDTGAFERMDYIRAISLGRLLLFAMKEHEYWAQQMILFGGIARPVTLDLWASRPNKGILRDNEVRLVGRSTI